MKKWLTSENLTTFGLMVAAVIVGAMLAPMAQGWFNTAKAKITGK